MRIAGVYSLADVADTYRGAYKQRVVDILCGYLRTTRSDDGSVESTVLQVLVKHLRKRSEGKRVTQLVGDDQLWCDCFIDLHGAVITEPFYFKNTTFNNDVNFEGAIFRNRVTFTGATFNSYTNFSATTFISIAHFGRLTFASTADFTHATFASKAHFVGTSFGIPIFWYATFNKSQPPQFDSDGPVACEVDLPYDKARLARFDDDGNVIKEDSPEQDADADKPGDHDDSET